MHLTPTQDDVVALLRDTGALREGHFEDPSGLHSNEYLQIPLALQHYQYQVRTSRIRLERERGREEGEGADNDVEEEAVGLASLEVEMKTGDPAAPDCTRG